MEDIANTTIDEMRHLVGALRSERDSTWTVAATALDELADPAGKPRVNVVGESDLLPLPAAVYRIARESASNTRAASCSRTSARSSY